MSLGPISNTSVSSFHNDELNPTSFDDTVIPSQKSKVAGMFGERPQHPSIACWTSAFDELCINAEKLKVPPGVFVIVAHGNELTGLTVSIPHKPEDKFKFRALTNAQVIAMVKAEMHSRGGQFTEVAFLSCDIGLNKERMNALAQGLGMQVSAADGYTYIQKDGRITVGPGERANASNRVYRDGEVSHIIKYFPNRPDYQVYSSCDNDTLHNCIPRN
jgi:hypothetical protein